MSYSLNSLGHEETYRFIDKNEVEFLRKKIDSLEVKAAENELNLKNLQKTYRSLLNSSSSLVKQVEKNHLDTKLKVFSNQCEWLKELRTKSFDFTVDELLEKLPFDDIDGGVWKQGFDITYDQAQWTQEKKLNIIVVPHSHNDAGWIMTFEEYFNQRTKNIIDTIVNSLSEKQTRTFIWAETSFLSLWWKQASDEMRTKLRKLVLDTKQLEIVTGGWVMTDEANSHYYAMIEQMIEGHEWLKNNIDQSIRPKYGWSIDPFGYTPTMPYLLKQMGFDGMLIQRVHYHLKKYMAQTQRFEFKWKQSWSSQSSKDSSIYCHVMPFYSYDIPHTCGPDPKICCQFDFKRINSNLFCPWGIAPQLITENNVEERAKLLLDQYRKKSQLYGDKNNHNTLLVSLGDDFRYQDMKEAEAQFNNYQLLMNYMNSRRDWNVNIKFGTLSEYFELLEENNRKNGVKSETFSGDFFTYADRQDHYWSGYFTSRPFYKRLDRVVEAYLRSAEISFSLSNLKQISSETKFAQANQLYKELLIARRNLGIFQHHDAIVGTSKAYVMLDYSQKLYLALTHCKNIIEQSISYLISDTSTNQNIFDIDDVRLSQTNNIQKFIYLSKDLPQQKLVLFNSNLNKREEIVSIRINTRNFEILKSDGSILENIQVSLIWPNTDGGYLSDKLTDRLLNEKDLTFSLNHDKSNYEVLFQVYLEPLSLATFTIRFKPDVTQTLTQTSFYVHSIDAEILNEIETELKNNFIEVKKSLDDEFIKLNSGSNYEAYFSQKTGYLNKFVSAKNNIKTNLKLVKYGTTQQREKSGAYLFLPDGPAIDIDEAMFQWIRVEHSGLIRNRVCVNMTLVLHCIELYPSLNNGLKLSLPLFGIWNVVDLRQSHNYELAMNIKTDINNQDLLYTDLNGFQYTKRKKYDKLTLQGNIYPMPSGSFIQDESTRLNVLTAQPLGAGSLEKGTIQVFLDRKLDQDDNRGMEEAMTDNVVVSNKFLIIFESINKNSDSNSPAKQHLSLLANLLSNNLLHPVVKLFHKNSKINILDSKAYVNSKNIPCDLRMVNLRSMQTINEEPKPAHVGLILHRISFDDCVSNESYLNQDNLVLNECNSKKDRIKFKDLFESITNKDMSIRNTYLTLNFKSNDDISVSKEDFILDIIQPMQIEAFRIDFN